MVASIHVFNQYLRIGISACLFIFFPLGAMADAPPPSVNSPGYSPGMPPPSLPNPGIPKPNDVRLGGQTGSPFAWTFELTIRSDLPVTLQNGVFVSSVSSRADTLNRILAEAGLKKIEPQFPPGSPYLLNKNKLIDPSLCFVGELTPSADAAATNLLNRLNSLEFVLFAYPYGGPSFTLCRQNLPQLPASNTPPPSTSPPLVAPASSANLLGSSANTLDTATGNPLFRHTPQNRDWGKDGDVFVFATLPTPAGADIVVMDAASVWQAYRDCPSSPTYASGALNTLGSIRVANIPLDRARLKGVKVYIGYGLKTQPGVAGASCRNMLEQGTYGLVYLFN